MTPRRIDQVISAFSARDAASNQMVIFQRLLRARGFDGDIYAAEVARDSTSLCRPFARYLSDRHPDSILVYHCAIGSPLPLAFIGLDAFLVSYFHNCTPAEFFDNAGNRALGQMCREAYRQLHLVRELTQYWWTDSQFSADFLISSGCHQPFILPIYRIWKEFASLEVDEAWRARLVGKRTILSIGRLSPNKAQHDLVLLLHLMKTFHPEPVRLVLAGQQSAGVDPYFQRSIVDLAAKLDLTIAMGTDQTAFRSDIVITGSVSDEEVVALYRGSDVLVSVSEHEGFGVPLLEAMTLGLPIVAHPAGSVAGVCGSGALLVDKAQFVRFFQAVRSVLADRSAAERLRRAGYERARTFSDEESERRFDECLEATLTRYSTWASRHSHGGTTVP
jgi:glycosyltransferase involved in cell wall biosynthesis